MTRLLTGLALLAAFMLPQAVHAQTDDVASDRFNELKTEYQKLKRDKETEKSDLRKARSQTSKELLELATSCDDSKLGVEMLTWVMQENPNNRKSKKAIEIFSERFVDSPDIGDAISQNWPKETLGAIVEKNENESVVAIATYNLAMTEKDADKQEEIFNKLKEKHGDVVYKKKKLAALVDSQLKTLLYRVGKVPPDIVGVDIDGNDFKLSDYRGKVVMLDFWGDW